MGVEPPILPLHPLPVPQDGSQLRLSEADRKALVFGLALHEKGKASLAAGSVQVRPHRCCKHTAASISVLQAYCCKCTVPLSLLCGMPWSCSVVCQQHCLWQQACELCWAYYRIAWLPCRSAQSWAVGAVSQCCLGADTHVAGLLPLVLLNTCNTACCVLLLLSLWRGAANQRRPTADRQARMAVPTLQPWRFTRHAVNNCCPAMPCHVTSCPVHLTCRGRWMSCSLPRRALVL